MTLLIGLGTNEGWVAPITMGIPFVVALLGVTFMGYLVMRGDSRNRAHESEFGGLGEAEQPSTEPVGSTVEPAPAPPSAAAEPPTREAPRRRRPRTPRVNPEEET